MAVKIQKKGNQWCVVEPDGAELKDGCFPTEAEATTMMKAVNSKLESKETNRKQIPYGVLSFGDAEIAEEARESAMKVEELTWNFQDILWNIMASPEIPDKPLAIRGLAGEYADRLEVLAKQNPMKEIGELPDSSFLYVDNETGERYFQFKELDGKISAETLKSAIKEIDETNFDEEIKEAIILSAKNILFAIGEENTNPISKAIDAIKRAAGHQKERRDDVLIWKDQDGVYRWVARYSNNFRDDDYPVKEIISGKSHEKFVKMVDGEIVEPPVLLIWHEEDLEIGKSEWVAYDTKGFAIAGGYIYKEYNDYVSELKSLGTIKCSHGMPQWSIQRDEIDKSIIVEHITTEISLLPGFAAANKLTGFVIVSDDASL